jgi:hypothetical protein
MFSQSEVLSVIPIHCSNLHHMWLDVQPVITIQFYFNQADDKAVNFVGIFNNIWTVVSSQSKKKKKTKEMLLHSVNNNKKKEKKEKQDQTKLEWVPNVQICKRGRNKFTHMISYMYMYNAVLNFMNGFSFNFAHGLIVMCDLQITIVRTLESTLWFWTPITPNRRLKNIWVPSIC